MRKPKPETHQECRSLLQKAVRRGAVDLTAKVVKHLQDAGDNKWLQMRVAVITFEECWPLGALLPLRSGDKCTMEVFIRVTRSVKFKDAAGLGTLGYALSKGDESVLHKTTEDRPIRIICEAIKRPHDFWTWVATQASNDKQAILIEAAHKAYRRGGWPWDRAFMQAAAYLAIINGVPNVHCSEAILPLFPFWVALDKHTPPGKDALREAAKRLGIPFRQAQWLNFYFESSVTNEAATSCWWSREVEWRLSRLGLSHQEGERIWQKMRMMVTESLKDRSDELARHIEHCTLAQFEEKAHRQLSLHDILGKDHI